MITRWDCRPIVIKALILSAVLSSSSASAPYDNNILPAADNPDLDSPKFININESDIILDYGQNYTLICKGKRNVQIKQKLITEDGKESFEKIETRKKVSETEYLAVLEMIHVDRFAVGYYACFDDTVEENKVLVYLNEEPVNSAHISYIYIYVNGSNFMFAPAKEMVTTPGGSEVLIECRPTMPDLNVTLQLNNIQQDFVKYSPKIGFLTVLNSSQHVKCRAFRRGDIETKMIHCIIDPTPPPTPKVSLGSKYFLEGETFSINCTAEYQQNLPMILYWSYPIGFKGNVMNSSNYLSVPATRNEIYYNNITVINATKDDAGTYTCRATNGARDSDMLLVQKEVAVKKIFKERPFINIKMGNKVNAPVKTSNIHLQMSVDDYPPAKFILLKDGKELRNNSKYNFVRQGNSVVLHLRNLTVLDTANYTVLARNEYNGIITENKQLTYNIRKLAAPSIDFYQDPLKRYEMNTTVTLKCDVTGYPLPQVVWSVTSLDDDNPAHERTLKANNRIKSLYEIESLLEVNVRDSGKIICSASNSEGNASQMIDFLVYEIAGGFGIPDNPNTWFPEGGNAYYKCLASKYDYENITWIPPSYNRNGEDNVQYWETDLSIVAVLSIKNISQSQAGKYTCIASKIDGFNETDHRSIVITVEGVRPPQIQKPKVDERLETLPYQPVEFHCLADAVPQPQIQWYKDGSLLNESELVHIVTIPISNSILNSTIKIKRMQEEVTGEYSCEVSSGINTMSRKYSVIMKEKSGLKASYLSLIGVFFLMLVILIIYLVWKVRKEKQFRKELAAAGLLYFKKGVAGSINPELGIDEQAELLPYDDKFEFPPDKLKLGKQLGAGAFGVVYKAEARGIINAEETTTVAVKMVKKTADNMYIKALASELKIMVHMGKHVNIVNLLGACTKSVGKRELIVIVEFCKFGNIYNYLRKHREVFIDQFSDEKTKKGGRVNKAFSCSNGSTGMESDYFGSNQTQNTDNTCLNSANTNHSTRKVSETGYVQPEWRSNYECDYSYDGHSLRPLCSRDLLCWAFQIARGMEYLASRKVLHGDLAARNILLAEDNVVKICDFGLARSIYKNDEYQKKENSPLPVKWLAIECMTDRIFSTQSDVWSFGIVLWELFTLAKTPYPNISPRDLLQWLSAGKRLEKPAFANDMVYDMMMQCWDVKPTARPTFTQLQESLGAFLEENVRQHYIDLNAMNMESNEAQRAAAVEDYLAMVAAPDYNNMITPSHHYVNDGRSFFPVTPTVQLQHDDEGYLQMSPASQNQKIFSPRAPEPKFDFDARKLNNRDSAVEMHSELTPMLTLNNLPNRGGSESDQENNLSPYLNMCPKIEEEIDEVFDTKYNTNNILNSAVTNPTYITFNIDAEKKPQNINKYVNIKPNGLVN